MSSTQGAYFLDTSVAGLILDGELWTRSPEKLPRYYPELSWASCSSLKEVGDHPSVQRVRMAYEWSKEFKHSGGRIMITPSVKLELLSAPQVSFDSI